MEAADLVEFCSRVQELPYQWPAQPDAASTGSAGKGTCAGKHALLAERLKALGISTTPLLVVGPLAPSIWPDLVEEADGLLEVHECLTVLTEWSGPLIVDVTWHPAAVELGLPGMTAEWDGQSDLPVAVDARGPGYAVGDSAGLRNAKERLRKRLYNLEERERRDRVLAEIAARANPT